MPPKKTPFEKALLSVITLLYAVGRRSLPNINAKKIKDFKDPRYLTAEGKPTVALRDNLTDESKEKIRVALEQSNGDEKKTAASLINDVDFLQSVNNIFSDSYLNYVMPETPAAVQTPVSASARALPETPTAVQTPVSASARALVDDTRDEKLTMEQEFQEFQELKEFQEFKDSVLSPEDKVALTEEEQFIVFGLFKKDMLKSKKSKKSKKEKEEKEEPAIDKPETRALVEELVKEVKTLRSQGEEQGRAIATAIDMMQDIKDTVAKIQETPELKTIESKIRLELNKKNVDEFKGLPISKKAIEQIISTIPSNYRQLLRPAVNGLIGDNLNINQVVAGLVGVAVANMPMGSKLAGYASSEAIGYIFDAFGVNLNNILSGPTPAPTRPSSESASALSSVQSAEQPQQRSVNELLRMARLPSPDELKISAQAGAAAGALVGGISSGSAMTAVSNIPSGLVAGAGASLLTTGAANTVADIIINRLTRNGVDITPERKKQIKLFATGLSPVLAASYMAYNPENIEPVGYGVTSGAGVTERLLTVSPDIISQTKAQETQTATGYKIWQPKSISPTTDILNETNQEKYADDLEFIAYQFIAPGSEGAPGTIDTNPLKRLQATADSIRYTDAGVTIPYLLWNQINDPITMKPTQLEKLALGVELPPMEFMEQDNETTFENVATIQYPNNENTEIEFLSPYSNFSNVDNIWFKNEDNILFTVNP